jgi:hypothetical protein
MRAREAKNRSREPDDITGVFDAERTRHILSMGYAI